MRVRFVYPHQWYLKCLYRDALSHITQVERNTTLYEERYLMYGFPLKNEIIIYKK